MMNKKTYLASVKDRITSDVEGEVMWDAYRGCAMLHDATMAHFINRGHAMGVNAQTAGVYLHHCQPGIVGLKKAMAATGFDRRGKVIRCPVG